MLKPPPISDPPDPLETGVVCLDHEDSFEDSDDYPFSHWFIPKSKSTSCTLRSAIQISCRQAMMSEDVIQSHFFDIVTYLPPDILSVDKRKPSRYSVADFDGICVDIGAEISVCGRLQAQNY